MMIGAVAGLAWVLGGGSYLAALALYSLVATSFILGTALLAHALSERRSRRLAAEDETLHAAE
jgi:hypothetical protein